MSDLLGIEELRETVRGVLFDRAPDTIDIPDEAGRGFDVALWKEMATLGWLGLAVPEVHGGLALGIGHLAVLYEELGYHLASVPILETMIAATALSRHGDAEMQARWLPAIVTGECRAAVAFSKTSGMPTIGSDNRITGALDHVAVGDVATLLVVPVRGASGIALALGHRYCLDIHDLVQLQLVCQFLSLGAPWQCSSDRESTIDSQRRVSARWGRRTRSWCIGLLSSKLNYVVLVQIV